MKLTKVDVTRYSITNPFVQSMFRAGFRIKTSITPNGQEKVWLVK